MNIREKTALFFISLLTLTLEMIQMRILGYSTQPVLCYSAISFAMIGFGLGASIPSIYPRILNFHHEKIFPALLFLFGISIFISGILIGFFPRSNLSLSDSGIYSAIFLIILPSIFPYLFAGLFLAFSFSKFVSESGKLYFYNLTGSAIGCFIPLFFLRPLGAEIILAALASSSLLISWSISKIKRKFKKAFWGGLALFLLALSPFYSHFIFNFKPDPRDQISLLTVDAIKAQKPPPRKIFSRWDPVAKVEVYEIPETYIKVPEKTEFKIVMVDSGANTIIMNPPTKTTPDHNWGRELFEESLYGAGYLVAPPKPDVLIIGSGGGTDIHCALYHNAKKIVGIEINKTMIETTFEKFGFFSGLKPDNNFIKIIHADGRNFVRSTSEKFDLVQLSGVDTYTLNSPGAMVIVENYLYTVEGFMDFLNVLRDDGVLSVTRFSGEGTRLGSIAFRALQKSGYANPHQRIVLLKQKRLEGVLVKKTPFTEKDLSKITKLTSRKFKTLVSIPPYDPYGIELSAPVEAVFLPRIYGYENAMKKIVSSSPPTDDKPYYMIFEWWSRAVKLPSTVLFVRNTWLTIILLSLIFCILPLITLRKHHHFSLSTPFFLLFFLFISAGYMFFEIGSIQKGIIYIGYPGGSAALVIASLLIGSGIGSYATEKFKISKERIIILAGIFSFTGVCITGVCGKEIFEILSSLPPHLRWLVFSIFIAILGFPMGMLYPTGLKIIQQKSPSLLPWAISINSFMSAVFSVLALPIGLSKGHKFLILCGAFSYTAALLSSILSTLSSKWFYSKDKK